MPNLRVVRSIAMPKLFSNYSPRFGFIGCVLAISDCNDSKLGYRVLKQSFRKAFHFFNFFIIITEPQSVAPKLN